MSILDRPGSATAELVPAGDASLVRRGDTPDLRRRARPRVSNVALKVTMAVTGAIFVAFVFVHMIGNLKVFFGPEDYNNYAAFLRTLLYPLLPYEGALWIFRIVLSVCLVLHVASGLTIWVRARASRGRFARRSMRSLTFGARTMVLSGLVMLGFVVVHLLDLTIGTLVASADFRHPELLSGHEVEMHAYENLVASLSRPAMGIFYTLVMVVLAVHIAQGCWNVVNDLGVTGARLRRIGLLVGLLIALAIVVCNGALPLLILAGVIA